MGIPGKVKSPTYPTIFPSVATRVTFQHCSVLSTTLTVILPLWGQSLMAPVRIMAQKQKLADLVFGRFRIVDSKNGRTTT